MTIEIHRPELEALILQRMESGSFESVEDALMQALEASTPIAAHEGISRDKRTGAELIAAFQASPYPEIDLTPPRVLITKVRDVIL